MIGDAQQKGPEKTTSEFAPSETLNKEQQTEESDLTAEAGINAGNILDGIDDNGEMVDSLKMSESGEGVGEHRQATGKKFGDFKQKII